MPKAKPIKSLSGFLDSDDAQSDVDMMPIPDSNQENQPAAKGRGKSKAASTARKAKPRAKRLSAQKTKPNKRAPLKDQPNTEQHSDTEEVDEFDEPVEQHKKEESEKQASSDKLEVPIKKQPTRKGRPPGKAKQTAAKVAAEKEQTAQRDGEFEYTPTSKRAGRKGPMAKNKAAAAQDEEESAIAETQDVNVDQDDSTMLSIEQDDVIPASVYRKTSQARSTSRQPPPLGAANSRRKAVSALDNDRGGNDLTVRRKLGEMTRKFENLDVKYRNLRDIGVKEAGANFEKLKKQSEERQKAANDLISSIRSELATQKAITNEARIHRVDVSATQSSLEDAETRITELTAALTQSQNDNRTLQAKLAASRAASATVESASVPKTQSSAVKGKGAARTIMVGSAEAAHAAQVAQLKEDLYSDLTGLILRGVSRQEDADVYDCIQTGRNGTLHFNLAVSIDKDNSVSYEDTEFLYTPRLDENRDRDLIDILPDYLTDEISFSRVNAAKFYSRVVDTLTRKFVD